MSTSFTPAPWAVYSKAVELNLTSFYGIDGGKGEPVVLWDKHGGIQVEANARLIAAAPDLLEALTECSRALRMLGHTDVVGYELASLAIAKATGGAV